MTKYTSIPEQTWAVLSEAGARYEQNCEVRLTCNFDEESTKAYSGTYFPRTLVEFANIVTEMLTVNDIRNAIESRETFRILDIGSGTGGAVAGTLLALRDHLPLSKPLVVEVTSVDCNPNAIAFQENVLPLICDTLLNPATDIVEIAPRQVSRDVCITKHLKELGAEPDSRYDIVIASKVLNEITATLIEERGSTCHLSASSIAGYIADIILKMSQLLSPSGFLLLNDITCKVSESHNYFPTILNHAVKKSVRISGSKLHILNPIPCSANAQSCNSKCFTSRSYRYTNPLRSKPFPDCQTDYSKVTSYVMTNDGDIKTAVAFAYDRCTPYTLNDTNNECCIGGVKMDERPANNILPSLPVYSY